MFKYFLKFLNWLNYYFIFKFLNIHIIYSITSKCLLKLFSLNSLINFFLYYLIRILDNFRLYIFDLFFIIINRTNPFKFIDNLFISLKYLIFKWLDPLFISLELLISIWLKFILKARLLELQLFRHNIDRPCTKIECLINYWSILF